jgi:hypothetical protein
MLRHVVIIKAPEGTASADLDALVDALAALPAQISEIGTYEVGRDLGLREGNGSVGISATFASPADLNAYIDHPAHQRVVTEHIRAIGAETFRVQF